MTKIVPFCLFIFYFTGLLETVFAQEKVNTDRLDSIFCHLAFRKEALSDSVKYTGWGGGIGYTWQRGKGKGWTTGQRITLHHVKPEEVAVVRAVFESYKDSLFVRFSDNGAQTLEEVSNTYYGYQYDEQHTLFFLKAVTTDQICIPINWTTLNYLDYVPRERFPHAGDCEKRLLGLSRLWAGMQRNFVFMDRVKLDWDSLYVAMIPQVMVAKSDWECLRLLQKMAASVQDGHTYVYSTCIWVVSAPFTTKLIDGHVYVDKVYSSEMTKKGVKRGVEITSINGKNVFEYGRQEIAPYVSSSTPQWTAYQTYEGSSLTKRPGDDTLVIEFGEGKKGFSIDYVSGSDDWDLQKEEKTLEWKVLPKNIGVLTIKSFNNSSITAEFDSLYPYILLTDALIIDIRNNGGGNSGYADYILRHFSKQKIKTDSWRSPQYIPAWASWGMKQPWYEKDNEYMEPVQDKPVYEKPIAVLINAGTFSAAEDFCGVFKGMKRGPLIGSKTGGSTGNGVRVELVPECSYANICSKHDTAPDGTEFVGIGFLPDIEVKESYDSYFKMKTDAATSCAIEYLRGKLR